jgi:lipoprotein Spr
MKTLLCGLLILISINTHAQIPDSSLNEDNKKLYKFIQEWWHTPYKWGGTTKRGIDCSAFTQTLYNKVYDIKLPRVAKDQYKKGVSIKREEAKSGDLVFFKSSGPSGWHVGMYLIDGWFVHSGVSNGVFISNLEDPDYKNKIRGFKRIL